MNCSCARIGQLSCHCCVPFLAVVVVAGGGFVLLVLILLLSICLCWIRRQARKLEAEKGGAEPDDPDVHYASLQNLALAQVGDPQPEPPGPRHTDYASVAEVKGLVEECGGGAPGELVQDPQDGVAPN